MNIDFPEIIKDQFSDEKLPGWMADIFQLSDGATFSDIPTDLEVSSLAEIEAINHFLQIYLSRRMKDAGLKQKKCFPYSELVLDRGLITNLKLSVRTSNCLNRLLNDANGSIKVNQITFKMLYHLPAMGTKSILEFLIAIEKYSPTIKFQVALTADKNEETNSDNDKTLKLNKVLYKFNELDCIDQIICGDFRFPYLRMSFPTANYIPGSSLQDLLDEIGEGFSQWSNEAQTRYKEALENTLLKISEIDEEPLDEAFKGLVKMSFKRLKEKNLEALYDRFGINSYGVLTLEECGKKAGLTRERIRQLESKVIKNVESIPGHGIIYLPKLDKALELIRENIGKNVVEIQRLFKKHGISSTEISVSSIFLFARLLRRNYVGLTLSKVNKDVTIVTGENIDPSAIMVQLNKFYSRNGIVDLKLALDACNESNPNLIYEEIKSVVLNSGKWKSLDSDKRWWVNMESGQVARNRLINVARKILSVCNPVSIEDVRNGYIRMARYRNSSHSHYIKTPIVPPPKEAMLLFFSQSDNFNMDGNKVSTNQFLDYKKELGDTELTLVESLLTSQSGLMTRSELLRLGMERGKNESSLSLFITFSPVLEHLSFDTHKIVGKEISIENYSAYLDFRSEKNKSRRLLICDWYNGLIRFVIRCPEFISNIVVGCPSSVKNLLLNKKFNVIDEISNDHAGTIGINKDGTMYGMNTYCHKYGLEENDLLIIKINLLSGVALLSTGIIEEYIDIIES